jgi:formylmethanofuran dehydrogenase subunit E-like metal-binding protein
VRSEALLCKARACIQNFHGWQILNYQNKMPRRAQRSLALQGASVYSKFPWMANFELSD